MKQGWQVEKLKLEWLDIENGKRGPSEIFNFSTFNYALSWVRGSNHLLGGSGLRKLCKSIDFQKVVENRDIQFDVRTFDEDAYCEDENDLKRHHKIFSNRQKEIQEDPSILKKAVLASASIPGFFEPVCINGRWYSDAFTFSIKSVLDAGCKTVFVFLNEPLHPKRKTYIEHWLNRTQLQQRRYTHIENKKEIARYRENVIVFQIDQPVPGLSSIDFKKGSITEAMKIAFDRGLEILEHIC